ncbi:MAG: hypothetical protein ACRDOK_04525 [Streptosporangiaceae bacterium]
MSCNWSIRPFSNDTQVDCAKREHLELTDPEHQAVLRDYAYPGSSTIITWLAGDRREFSGSWPGYCTKLGLHQLSSCKLPAGHGGRCAP